MTVAALITVEMKWWIARRDSNVLKGLYVVKYIDFGIFWETVPNGITLISAKIYGPR